MTETNEYKGKKLTVEEVKDYLQSVTECVMLKPESFKMHGGGDMTFIVDDVNKYVTTTCDDNINVETFEEFMFDAKKHDSIILL